MGWKSWFAKTNQLEFVFCSISCNKSYNISCQVFSLLLEGLSLFALLFQEKFTDVVNWLKANAGKGESFPASGFNTAEKKMMPETKADEIKLFQAKPGFTPVSSAATSATSWSFGLLPNNQCSTGAFPSNQSSAGALSSNQSSASAFSNNQSSAGVFFSGQSSTGAFSNNQTSAGAFSDNQTSAGAFCNNFSSAGAFSNSQSSGALSNKQSTGVFCGSQSQALFGGNQIFGAFSNSQKPNSSNDQSSGLFQKPNSSNDQNSGLFSNNQTIQSSGLFSNNQTPFLFGKSCSTILLYFYVIVAQSLGSYYY